MRVRTIALIAAAAAGLGACGSSTSDTASTAAAPAVTAAAPAPVATTPESTTATPKGPATVAGISTDVANKPNIPKPSGKEPTKLVMKDIVVGTGSGAKAGDNLVVNYVGVLYKTGKQFDASWDAGRTFPFALGQGNVIPGWDQGLVGMKIGGRRMLTIPPDLAYGAEGHPPSIGPNATLVFVIDLLNDTPGAG